jgi:uncharacterized protein
MTGAQILVVTVPDLQGNEISTFAAEKGKQYGIGDKDKNNGLVYVVSVDDHKDFLATGYGMESVITDVKATEITDNAGSHAKYKSGDYDAGVLIILDRIQTSLNGKSLSDSSPSESEYDHLMYKIIAVYAVIIAIIIFGAPGASYLIDRTIFRRTGKWPTHHGRGDGSSSAGVRFSSGGNSGGGHGSSVGSWSGSGGGGSFDGGGGGSSW